MPAEEKKTRSRSSGRLSTVNEHPAGLNVASTFHVVAVRGDQDDDPVRTFRKRPAILSITHKYSKGNLPCIN